MLHKNRTGRRAFSAVAVAAVTAATTPLLSAAQASETRTALASADAYVSASKTATNYGSSSTLWIDGSPVMRNYLRFDVPTAGGLVKGQLSVYVTRSSQAFEVRQVASTTWDESTITYANAPAVGSSAVRSGPVAKGAWATIDVTALLPDSGPVTLALTPVSGSSQSIASREAGSTRAPRLVLEHAGSTTAPPDTQAPTVSLTNPRSGTSYTTAQSVPVTASVGDDVGVTKVEFYDNGTYQGAEDTAPFSYTWAVSSAANGSHRWTARAYDAQGNTTTSQPVDVSVAVPTSTPPTSPPSTGATDPVTASVETVAVPNSGDAADDVAVWVHPTDPAQSTVIGTDKLGGLAVYDLAGRQLAYYADSKPNNVDIRYGFPLGGERVALVVTSDRTTNALRAYKVNTATRTLEHVSARTLSVGIGLYGLCSYRSPVSGKYYAFDSDSSGTLQQWELFDDGTGKVDARKVRQVSVGSTAEGCVADDDTGALFLAEEDVAIWRYDAEPTGGTTRTRVDSVGSGRLVADIEGLSIYYGTGGTGYLIASSQGSGSFAVYDRKAPHAVAGTFTVEAGVVDAVSYTDGLDVLSTPLGAGFPEGVFLAQDDRNDGGNQNYKLVPWGRIARSTSTPLLIDTGWNPRGTTFGAAPAPTSSPSPTSSPTPTVSPSSPSSPSPSPSASPTASPAPTPTATSSPTPTTAPTFYVSPTGSDTSTGLSPQAAWRSLSKVNSVTLSPGSSVLLARGGSWTGPLLPKGSGTSDARTAIGAYGTGAAPVVRDSTTCVEVSGSYVTVRELEIRGCSWAGITVHGSSNLLEGNLITDTAAGVYLKPGARSNKVLRNRLIDNNRMSVLTSSTSNDDSGAFGILLRGDDNEIGWNTINGSDAFSYDYGRDGAAIEVYGGSGNHVHHNVAVDNDAFTELGDPRSADNTFAYNDVRSSLATSVFMVTRGAESRYGPVLRTRLLNNSVLLTGASSQGFVCHAGCGPEILTMRNNVIQAGWKVGYADAPFDEGNGVYFGGQRQFVLGVGSVVSVPGFVDGTAGDLRLVASSPAVDRGVRVPYDVDLDGLSTPVDGDDDGVVTTDVGAYERRR